ncbi:flagellar motor switch protein FliG [Nitrospira sp. Kam-Ns4a]
MAASSSRKLSGEEKAAILLRAIGEDAAAAVMRHLEPKDIRKIGAYMAELSNISREEEEAVIREFKEANAMGAVGFEGKEYIRAILTKALGPEKASRILETLTTTSYPGLESLKWLDPRAVAQLIKVEHPQTIAVVLSQMDPEQGSQVLAALPEALRADVTMRVALIEDVQPEVLKQLSDVLQEALKVNGPSRGERLGGAEVAAELLTRLDKSVENGIMARLTERNAELAETIRSLMFVFEDLVQVDDRGMQELLKEVSKDDLALALRAASPEVRDKVFRNMSSRAAEMLKEDMEARGPVRVSEVEKAQQNILKLCRKLEEEGRLVVGGAGEEFV